MIMQDNVNYICFGSDPVAIAKAVIPAGTQLKIGGGAVTILSQIPKGHRFALRDIPAGEYILQFGYPFAQSKGITQGDLLTVQNTLAKIPESSASEFFPPPVTRSNPEYASLTFQGYQRPNGKIGTRNYYLVVPTSMCAAETALQIAVLLESPFQKQKHVSIIDGVVALPHTEGCGCASTGQIDRLLTVLAGFVGHANVAGCLILDLGCEQTDYAKVHGALRNTIASSGKPVDWLTIQKTGGTQATITSAVDLIQQRLHTIQPAVRTSCPLSSLMLGTECGASDSFSGITANPLIGAVADRVILAGGAAILSEIPEMLGIYDMLFSRFRSLGVAGKFHDAVTWYLSLASKLGVNISDNLVPKNIEGGLINSYLKSLGAVLKGGTTPIEDVVGYGEPAVPAGLSIMQGPGGDIESVTGLVSSGANLICFSTGYGAITGSAICPVIKISSTTETYNALPDDIDFDAGKLLTECSMEHLAEELLTYVIRVASGEKTATERMMQRQFQIWTAGKLSL